MIRTWISWSMRLGPQRQHEEQSRGWARCVFGAGWRPAPNDSPVPQVGDSRSLGLGDDALERRRPAGADLIARDDATLDVAIRIEAGRPDDRVEAAGGHDGLEDRQPVEGVRACLGEGVKDDLRRGLGHRRVERRLRPAVVDLVLVGPRLAGSLELADVDATEGQVRPVAGGTRAVVPGLLVDAVRTEHLDVRQSGLDVLPELGGALARDRPDEHDVSAGALDLLRQRGEVGGLGVVALGRAVGAHDGAADLAEVLRPGAADALAVGLAVIDDVGLLEAKGQRP